MPVKIGEIQGICEGYNFSKRIDMNASGFHRHPIKGIDGDKELGAGAIVLSEGYVDDEDKGETIIYTGEGGNKNGRQFADQTFESNGNASLITSFYNKTPVRVIRGYKHNSRFAPSQGYTYAGLYQVVKFWEAIGFHGYKICRFELHYCGSNQNELLKIYKECLKENNSAGSIRINSIIHELAISIEDIRSLLNQVNYSNYPIEINTKVSFAAYNFIKRIKNI
jgi:hypothetical protein